MKILPSLFIFALLLNSGIIAQPVINNNLSGLIIKKDLNQDIDRPVHPSDLRYLSSDASSVSFIDLPRENPGAAFFASALIPGSAQAINGKWGRAGAYFLAEVAGWIVHIDQINKAKSRERAYERFTHENWSVLAYAQWLVNYSQINGLNNGYEQLQQQIAGLQPDFSNTTNDWGKVNLSLLHNIERNTPFIFENRVGSNFSHTLPKYGSQQYYELISKYYQYQPGWRDFYNQVTTGSNQTMSAYTYMWNGRDMPFELFYRGRDQAELFNDNYRVAGNIIKLLIVNHVVSAFDGYFTVKLKNSRIEAQTNLLSYEQVSLRWHF